MSIRDRKQQLQNDVRDLMASGKTEAEIQSSLVEKVGKAENLDLLRVEDFRRITAALKLTGVLPQGTIKDTYKEHYAKLLFPVAEETVAVSTHAAEEEGQVDPAMLAAVMRALGQLGFTPAAARPPAPRTPTVPAVRPGPGVPGLISLLANRGNAVRNQTAASVPPVPATTAVVGNALGGQPGQAAQALQIGTQH